MLHAESRHTPGNRCASPPLIPKETADMEITQIVKEKYGQAALRAASGQNSSCCGAAPSGCDSAPDPITSNLYDESQKSELPETAVLASLGCGNPTALAELHPGETVLD